MLNNIILPAKINASYSNHYSKYIGQNYHSNSYIESPTVYSLITVISMCMPQKSLLHRLYASLDLSIASLNEVNSPDVSPVSGRSSGYRAVW